jgi:hypothetical protein
VGKVAKVGEHRVKLRQEQSAPVLAELHEKFFDWKEQFVAQAPYGGGVSVAVNRALAVLLSTGPRRHGRWRDTRFRGSISEMAHTVSG